MPARSRPAARVLSGLARLDPRRCTTAGYAFFKLGEEAHVSLEAFTLEGHAGKEYRQFLRRAERDRVRFRVLAPYEVERVLPRAHGHLGRLARSKRVRERQFSVGYFDPITSRGFPCAVVEDASGRIIAFANLLLGPGREETVDRPDALPRRCAAGDGLHVHLAVPLRQGAGLRRASTWGWRRSPASARFAARTRASALANLLLPARRDLVQLPGAAAIQGEVRAPSGCRATWPTRTRGSGRSPSRTSARSSRAGGDRCCGGSGGTTASSLVLQIDPKPLRHAVQRAAVDAHDLGGLRAVARARSRARAAGSAARSRRAAEGPRTAGPRAGAARWWNAGGRSPTIDDRAAAEQHEALDRVLELAHVAGPVVGGQRVERGRRELDLAARRGCTRSGGTGRRAAGCRPGARAAAARGWR